MIAQILVADDNEEIRAMLRDFLEAKGHRILEAVDGAQAFTLAEKERPHLIIMDVVMPGLYGSTALQLLKEYPSTRDIPVLIMSGSVDQPLRIGIEERAGLRFMRKPLDLASLDKTIREMLPEGGYTP